MFSEIAQAAVLLAGAALSAGAGVAAFRFAAKAGRASAWAWGAGAAIWVMNGWLHGAGEAGRSVGNVWNAARLAPSFALLHGYAMYYGPGEGPVIGNLYGPGLALAYLPCALFSRPHAALLAGSVMSFLLAGVPALLALRQAARGSGSQNALAGAGFVAWLALIRLWEPLLFTTFAVHADAPAIGLGLLACALAASIEPQRGWTAWLLPALAASLAVWTKQVMLPLLPALACWLWIAHGWRNAARFSLVLCCVFAAVSSACLGVFDARALWFNLVTVPANHPWQETLFWRVKFDPGAPVWLKAAKVLAEALVMTLWHLLQPLLIAGGIVLLKRALRRAENGVRVSRHGWTVFFTAGLFLIPAAVLGRVKVGGDINAFSYSAYFCYIGLMTMLIEERRFVGEVLRIHKLHGRFARAAAVAIVAAGLAALPESHAHWRRGASAGCPADAAVALAKAHPGEVYAAWNPLVGLMAEGKAYHFDYGIMDRRMAGFPLDEAHFRAHAPPRLRYVVVEYPLLEAQRYLPPMRAASLATTEGAVAAWEVANAASADASPQPATSPPAP